MDYVVIILLLLSIPVLGVAGFFIALGARTQVRQLQARVERLERSAALGLDAPMAAARDRRPLEPPAAPVAPPVAAPVPAPAPTPAKAAPAPAVPPVAAAIPETSAAAAPPAAPGFEERFGTRWVVWVGGLALALGGIFLVRYSIELGLIGPKLRVLFGALLAAALVVAGEWSRKRDTLMAAAVRGVPIPAILTAAGTTVAYATVYAAYALYGLLPPPLTFLLLGVVAIATLAGAMLHGPALAGLGLVGAYVTPLLVATGHPDYWALYVYLAVVTGAAFALARARMWRWLALTAIGLSVAWMLPGLLGAAIAAHAFHATAGFALAAVFIVAGLWLGPPARPGRVDAVSCGALALYALCAALLVVASRHDGLALLTFTLLVTATLAVAWRTDAAAGAVPAAAALAALVMAQWAVNLPVETLLAPAGPVAGVLSTDEGGTGRHFALGGYFALLFGVAGFLAQGRSALAMAPLLTAASAVLTPIAMLIALYYKTSGFAPSVPFAGLALLLAATFAFACETLHKRPPRPGSAGATAIFAVGTIAALALALTLALEKGWLTVALALMVPGIAFVADKRPLPMLRIAAAAIVVIVLARLGWEPRVVGRDVGTTPIFNWLLWGYGVPAAAFWLGARLLRRRADDQPARMVEAAALLFTVLTVVLQIRHLMTGGDIFRHRTGLAEIATDVCAGLAMAIGLEWVRRRSGSVIHNAGALVVAGLSALTIAFGVVTIFNPLVTGQPVGGTLVNLLLLGYGIPALLTIALALVTRATRPLWYRVGAAALSVALSLLYLSLEIRHLFHGPVLAGGGISNAEQYAYSVTWLAFGVVLLLIGIRLRSQPARLASAAVVLVTVAKVFLIDLSDLEGVYRAVSFIGLGLVLVGIGGVYQRLLFKASPAPPPADAPT